MSKSLRRLDAHLKKKELKMSFKDDDWDNLSFSGKLSYQQSLPVDCSFVIGEGANAKTVEAHKCILSKKSTVFEGMFSGAYKEADASFNIPLPAVLDYMDFKVILEYIYYDKTNFLEFLSLERLKHVSYLANLYMLEGLLNKCHSKIQTKVDENHTSFHDFLEIFEYEKKLGKKISTFLYKNSKIDYGNISKTFPYASVVLLTNTTTYIQLGTSIFLRFAKDTCF